MSRNEWGNARKYINQQQYIDAKIEWEALQARAHMRDEQARRRYHLANFERVGMDDGDLDLIDAFEEVGEGRRNRSRRRGNRQKRRKTRRGRHHSRSRKRQHKKRHSRKRHSRKRHH